MKRAAQHRPYCKHLPVKRTICEDSDDDNRRRRRRQIAIQAVQADGWRLSEFRDEFDNDTDVVLTAVRHDGDSLRYAATEMRGNVDVVMAAVEQYGSSLRYASVELRDNHRDIVRAAVERNGKALEYAGSRLRCDREIVLAAVRSSPSAIWFAGDDSLWLDFEILTVTVEGIATATDEQQSSRYSMDCLLNSVPFGPFRQRLIEIQVCLCGERWVGFPKESPEAFARFWCAEMILRESCLTKALQTRGSVCPEQVTARAVHGTTCSTYTQAAIELGTFSRVITSIARVYETTWWEYLMRFQKALESPLDNQVSISRNTICERGSCRS